jgi:uncharacterized protein (TIGR00730 family)
MYICIFASDAEVNEKYGNVAEEFARLLATHDHDLVVGASNHGLMKKIVDVVLQNGATITGVVAQSLMMPPGKGYEEIVEADLVKRKATMLEKSDAFAAMPGGLGTLDEVTELLEMKRHNLHEKPIVAVNIDGFFNGLKEQLERMNTEKFLPKNLSEYIAFVNTAEEAISYLESKVK